MTTTNPESSAPSEAGPAPLPKAYSPAATEPAVWRKWLDANAFHADPERVLNGEARPYSILIPPPNVTAALHLGHALNNTIQDILTRAHRMKGYEALWMPGTDHAGIATQTVVDRRLRAEGKPALAEYRKIEAEGGNGREQFTAHVQAFKDEYEKRITEQLQAMGCSCDWERQRFTMDSVCARAVREAFFRLFKDGLIERGKRLVNWDPVTQTALADDEVEMEEIEGAFYDLRYPLVHPGPITDNNPVTWGELAARAYPGADTHPDDEQAWVTVATTRPETYLGDVAVAVNPKDPRAPSLRGLCCRLPIVGRIIPIIEDDYVVLPVAFGGPEDDAKAQMSTGFLKVTPAHDPNDYELGRRHEATIVERCSAGTTLINVMAPDASISDKHGWTDLGDAHLFVGLGREEARKRVIAEFKARSVAEGQEGSLLERVRPHRHSVGHSYRSHAVIEPYLSDQWYCRVTDDRLRGHAQRAMVQDQRTEQSLVNWPESTPGVSSSGTGFQPVSSSPTPSTSPTTIPESLTIHRRHLPHWQRGGSTYFITFRVRQGELSDQERDEVLDACFHFHNDRAIVRLVTVMPDHVHMLMTPMERSKGEWWSLQDLMHSIKSFTANSINRARGAKGSLWQDEYFDRAVRDAADFKEKWNYMVLNPVRAGLTDKPGEYAWVRRGEVSLSRDDGLEARPTGGEDGLEARPTEENSDATMTFHPARYAKNYEFWHDNLRDWCISRQLWWGHRIPVWSTKWGWIRTGERGYIREYPNGARVSRDHSDIARFETVKRELSKWQEEGRIFYLDRSENYEPWDSSDEQLYLCVRNLDDLEVIEFLEKNTFAQDPDVLDTWFSSALWPLSTMGWPDAQQAAADTGLEDFTKLLEAFNPTSVLTTAREIITLWVSRMVMFNRYLGRSALRADSSGTSALRADSSGTSALRADSLTHNDQESARSADLPRLTELPPESVNSDTLGLVRPERFVGRDPYPPGAPSPRDFIRNDRRLPHIELANATYFVTWKTREGVFLDEHERQIVSGAVAYWHSRGCETYACSVMSNHVHALVRLPEDTRLAEWCSSIKKFSATQINQQRDASGSLWQPDRFDHIVRDEQDLNEFLAYIIRNGSEAKAVSLPSEDRFCFVSREIADHLVGRHSVPTLPSESGSQEEESARSADLPGPPPFKDIFIHAMIQDGEGRKMSKSLGNGVDPLDIIESHGADAMRFTLCQMTTQTQDVRMPVEKDPTTGKNTSPKFDIGRNLCNKLWNAGRFALTMLERHPVQGSAAFPIDPQQLSLVDRWMLSRLTAATAAINAAQRSYQFKDYADALYDLLWRDFCDWYLESIKPTLATDPNQPAVLRLVLDAILRLMHPVTPFITEALYEKVSLLPMKPIDGFAFAETKSTATLCQSGWPEPDGTLRDEVAETAFDRVRALVTAVREVRAAKQVPPKRAITLHTTPELAADIARWSPLIETLANVAAVTTDAAPANSVAMPFEGAEHRLSNLTDAVDAGAERDRLRTELAAIEKSVTALEGRLANPGYAQRAPAHLVQQTRDELESKQRDAAAIRKAIEDLG